ncbi:MAG: 3-phosphoserine/phosphohydroxythreonine transaminase, partial [Burkholderiales bacterium]
PQFTEVIERAQADLRELLGIPGNYHVLFLQGGASAQFAMAPMNLLGGKTCADYVHTGFWSGKAVDEARRYCKVNVAASSQAEGFTGVPAMDTWTLDPAAAYVHYTPNETIGGVEFHWLPESGDVPLVADFSSSILSHPVEVRRYGMIYAGAQKNIGPAGLTVVIVRDDLLREPLPGTPTLYDYRVHVANQSMYNTPPTFAIYVAGLTFRWLKTRGGLAAMEQRNIAKAHLLYRYLDSSSLFHCPVSPDDRSRMNVVFTLKDAALEGNFLTQAERSGLMNLRGHRALGGMRASIYNAMPIEGVQALVDFMRDFENAGG